MLMVWINNIFPVTSSFSYNNYRFRFFILTFVDFDVIFCPLIKKMFVFVHLLGLLIYFQDPNHKSLDPVESTDVDFFKCIVIASYF